MPKRNVRGRVRKLPARLLSSGQNPIFVLLGALPRHLLAQLLARDPAQLLAQDPAQLPVQDPAKLPAQEPASDRLSWPVQVASAVGFVRVCVLSFCMSDPVLDPRWVMCVPGQSLVACCVCRHVYAAGFRWPVACVCRCCRQAPAGAWVCAGL